MKFMLSALFLLIYSSLPIHAQKRSVAVANAYTLNDADGFPGHNYVNTFVYQPSGKVYAKDFYGNLHIIGNNFIKTIPGLKNMANETMLFPQPDNEMWLADGTDKTFIIKNDSLRKIIKTTKNLSHGLFSNYNATGILGVGMDKGTLTIYEFANYRWQAITKAPIPKNENSKTVRIEFVKTETDNELIVLFSKPNGDHSIYKPDPAKNQLQYLKTISLNDFIWGLPYLYMLKNNTLSINTALTNNFNRFIATRTGKNIKPGDYGNFIAVTDIPHICFTFAYGRNLYEYFTLNNNHIQASNIVFESDKKINGTRKNPAYPYLTVLTDDKPMRVFPYIKKYPRIFDQDNTNSIFTLAEDDKGRIWAGSYQRNLSIINPHSNNSAGVELKTSKQPYPFMNASLNYKDKIYLVGEFATGGILQYDMQRNMRKLKPDLATTGYYLYHAQKNDKIYYASADQGFPVFYCEAKELENKFIHWNKLDSAKGIQLHIGIRSMTEDTLGRLWMGHPNKGIAVYNPATQRGTSYLVDEQESPVGFVSSLTDKYGTVWMGTDKKGLWYYNDYKKATVPANIRQLNHPLLNTVQRITALAVYKNWLVISAYNRMCLLDLERFHQKREILVRYLNPQEAALTGTTEQNTLLVSKTDSSAWFSTSDMLPSLQG